MPRNANGCFAQTKKAVLVPFFAGGFSFCKSHFWETVPWDPYMLYIFNGEEFGIATRGWTHGYDFYSPPFDIVGHWYDKGPKRRSPHVGSNHESYKLRDRSEKRVNYLWNVLQLRTPELNPSKMSNQELQPFVELKEIEKYGLGNKRTLQQYWEFAGINIINKTFTVFDTQLWAQGGLTYVPWNQKQ